MRHLRIMSSVAVLTAAMTAGPAAQAGYGSWGGSYGSSGGGVDVAYGSSGGSSGGLGSSGGFASSGGSVGGGAKRGHRLGGLFQRLAHHRAARSSHGSSGGGFASYGSSGGFASHGSSGGGASYGSSGGFASHGSSGAVAVYKAYSVAPAIYGGSSGGSSGGYSSVPTYHYPAPVVPSYPQAAPPQDGSEPAAAEIGDDSVLMTVSVPETALVHVNGLPTSSTGPIRQFMSKGLKEGFLYKYEVEVLYEGATEPERRTVKLRAGATERLVFHAPEATTVAETSQDESQEPLETVVTVRVPADATVVLAGNETKGQGEVRTFRSRRLVDDQRWDGYTIRVTATVNGSVVSKERTLDLVAGETHDVSFEFDGTEVASR